MMIEERYDLKPGGGPKFTGWQVIDLKGLEKPRAFSTWEDAKKECTRLNWENGWRCDE